ncbi:hypothetical protein C7S14_1624 [Burkholderia cepacia]|nr:hypothetical protein C7S14_1624 [Burkholderia cepacia]
MNVMRPSARCRPAASPYCCALTVDDITAAPQPDQAQIHRRASER